MVKISLKFPVLKNLSYLIFIFKVFFSYSIVIQLDYSRGEKNLL